MKKQRKILIVDDEDLLLKDWKNFLNEENLGKIMTVNSGKRAIELNKKEKFDLALLDICLEQKIDGIYVLREIRKKTPECYCIMITAYNDLDPAREALKLGANDYLKKGILGRDDLIKAVKNGIKWLGLKEKNKRLEKEKRKAEIVKIESEITAKSERERYEELLIFTSGIIHELSPLIIPLRTYIEKGIEKYKRDSLLIIDHLSNLNNQLKEYVCGIVKSPKMERLDLADIIEDSVVLMGSITKDIELDYAYTNKPQYFVNGNKDKLHIIFRNFISNSVEAIQIRKKTENKLKGKITIDFANARKKVKISISDNGCGIPDVDKTKILKPFVTSKSDGIGLGMAIVKMIVESHYGKMSFDSRVNKGTTFNIEFPLISGDSN